ncbi:type VI secretion system tip protein VgrG [Burkholderia pyrrocinia]|uniref:type VI secretion system Vgr family protein n=1 Tax=Burkholderia pyrrocinia TaxID=60550 RepID=UPI00157757C6|nr:type VI secretion system Vgr family protein [Burkholderia pyrrocinia]NTX26623.1 type VI secretion system tip protein VgrG [Burkholderia pyrrocinia]
MFNPLQARTLAVSGAALPAYGVDGTPILQPVRLSGTEAIGELFEYTLELKTPDALAFAPSVAANVDLDRIVGTEVTVSIELEGIGRPVPGLPGAANIGAGTREITGLVTAARIVREDGRSIVYALTLRPWLWLATKNQDCRVFQNMTVVEITDAVLSAYTFPVEKRLYGPAPQTPYPARDTQRQHWQSDFEFIAMLWQEWGLYWWFEHSDGKQRLVLTDAMAAHQPHGDAYRTIRYEAPTGKRMDEEHIHALSLTSELTTGAVTVVDYDYLQPGARLTARQQDPRDTGHAEQEEYAWGDYAQPQAGTAAANRPRDEAAHLARVRLEALRCQGKRARGAGKLRGLQTGHTFTLTHYPQQAGNREYLVVSSRLVIEEVGEASGAGQQYHCEANFELQPTNEPFRLLRTIARPRVHGPEYAIVTGPKDQEIWTDAQGRIKLQFLWDRLGKKDERSSCWVRVSSPWQGNQFGAMHLPRIGQEVIVDFINGDPDLPIVMGRVVNAHNEAGWKLPDNHALSGFRSREIGGARANHFLQDDTKGQIQTQLASDHGASQLSLGHITRVEGNTGRREARGEGLELRTDRDGVVRAARGLLVTTEARPNARSHAKDMGETVARLTQARELQESMAGLAQQHEAQGSNDSQREIAKAIKAQNDAIRGGTKTGDNPFPEFAEPHLTLSSPAGIQLTTAGSTHLASDEHLAVSTGGDVGFATGKSFFASIANAFSLFVHKLGIRLVAASGKVRIQAQQDEVEIIAKKVVELMSTTDWINVTGKQGIRLSGGGSALEISAAGIVGFTHGKFLVHAGSHGTDGPQGKGAGFPPSLQSGPGQLELLRHYAGGQPVKHSEWTVTDSLGAVHRGTLDAAGRAIASGLAPGAVRVHFGRDPHDPWAADSYLKPPSWRPSDAAGTTPTGATASNDALPAVVPFV